MKACVLLLIFVPVQAWAIDGWTVFNGPDVPILETVEQDFPRHDLGELCRRALPGTSTATSSARTACKARQGRLAGLVSNGWNFLPPAARQECLKRADNANGYSYSVLYECVNAAAFKVQRRVKIGQIAEMIARQNGKARVDPQTVGSIR